MHRLGTCPPSFVGPGHPMQSSRVQTLPPDATFAESWSPLARCVRVVACPDGERLNEVRVLAGGPGGVGRRLGGTGALILRDPRLSRLHATFTASPHGLVIRDEGSQNGVYVNGRRVEEQPLRAGDVVRVGDSLLLVGCAGIEW